MALVNGDRQDKPTMQPWKATNQEIHTISIEPSLPRTADRLMDADRNAVLNGGDSSCIEPPLAHGNRRSVKKVTVKTGRDSHAIGLEDEVK